MYLFDLLGNDFEVVAEGLNAALDVGNEGVAGLGFRVEEGEIRLVKFGFRPSGFVGTLETLQFTSTILRCTTGDVVYTTATGFAVHGS